LWYVLAAANALSGDSELIAGTQLRVPEVGVSKNDASTFKPYNPNEIVGSTAPGLPYIPPQASNGCSHIITIVVLIAVAVVVPELAPYLYHAGLSASMAVGVAVGATTFVTHAAASAIGSLSGGVSFSWRNSLQEGLVAGVTAGLAQANILSKLGKLGGFIQSSQFAQAAYQAVLNNGINVAASKLTGVDSNFSWKSVAIQAVSNAIMAPTMAAIDKKLALAIEDDALLGSSSGLIGGVVSEAVRVGASRALGVETKFNLGQAIGNGFASATAAAFQARMNNRVYGEQAANDASITSNGLLDDIAHINDLSINIDFGSLDSTLSMPGLTPQRASSGLRSNGLSSDNQLLAQARALEYLGPALTGKESIAELREYVKDYTPSYKPHSGMLDSVSVSASGFNGAAGNNLSHGFGYGVYRPGIINAFKARGGTPYLAKPNIPRTGYPDGMTANQYRQAKNNQLFSDLKAAIFTPIPILADIKSGLEDIAIAVGTSGIPRTDEIGALIYVGAAFLPTTSVELGFSVVGGSQASKLLPGTGNAGRIGSVATNSGVDFVWHSSDEARKIQGVLNGINPDYLSSSNRFGKAFYVGEQPGTTVAELAHHGLDAKYSIRFELNQDAMEVLDLTDPKIANAWNCKGGPITSSTQALGVKAQEQGFNVIRFYSERANGGINNAVLDNFNEILKPLNVSSVKP
jgi:hypothetical protein